MHLFHQVTFKHDISQAYSLTTLLFNLSTSGNMPKDDQKVSCPPWTADKWLELAEVCAQIVKDNSAAISRRPEFAPWVPGRHMASRVKSVAEEMVEVYKARAVRAGGPSASGSATASPATKTMKTPTSSPSKPKTSGSSNGTPKKRKADDEFAWIVDDDEDTGEEKPKRTPKRAKVSKVSRKGRASGAHVPTSAKETR